MSSLQRWRFPPGPDGDRNRIHGPGIPSVVNSASRPRIGLAFRVVFAVVGLVFLVVAFRENWDRSRQHALPSG
jgi:hypothetical protein